MPRPTDKDKRAKAAEEAGPAPVAPAAPEPTAAATPESSPANAAEATPAETDPSAAHPAEATLPDEDRLETAGQAAPWGSAAPAGDDPAPKADRSGLDGADEPPADGIDAMPEAKAAAPAAPMPGTGRGGALLGGVVGAVLGAGATVLAFGGGLVPLPPDPAVPALQAEISEASKTTAALAADLATLGDATSGLGDRLARIEAQPVPPPTDLAPLTGRLDGVAARLDEIDARLTTLEKRPAEGGAASASALEAFGREMEALRGAVDAARADSAAAEERIAALVAEAEAQLATREAEAEAAAALAAEEAARLQARAARAALAAALSADRPIGPALAEAKAAGVALPPGLTDIAEPPSLADLQADFSPAARRALAAALKAEAGEGMADRALAFLRTQTGARSLEPRAGDDPDAILSRAEAALRSGDLTAALSEIAALPDPARAELAPWVERAEARRAVAEAVAALAADPE